MGDSPQFFVRNLICPFCINYLSVNNYLECSLQRIWKFEICVTQITCLASWSLEALGLVLHLFVPGKGKGHPRRGHETLKKVEIKFYSFFNLAARRVLLVNGTLRPIYPRQSSGIHCTVGWEGHRDGLEGYGKFLPSREFDPRTFQPVASRYTV